jgi:hypothetical protein
VQPKETAMHPTKRDARIAAILYLLMALPAPLSLLYIPDTLIVRGDATATASKVLAHEALFRIGIAAELFSLVSFIFLVFALYRLLSGVNNFHAWLMVAFVVVAVGIGLVNALFNVMALSIFRGAHFLEVFDKRQLDALGMLFLILRDKGLAIAQIFWGLWLLPFGVLVMRSRFLPRILGILLIVNCFGYLVASAAALFWPRYASLIFNAIQPALLGELWIILWLLITGVKEQSLVATAS